MALNISILINIALVVFLVIQFVESHYESNRADQNYDDWEEEEMKNRELQLKLDQISEILDG